MSTAADDGVVFKRAASGRRSTLAANRAIFAAAARAADEELADRIEAEDDWRSNYVGYVRDLTARGARSADVSTAIARVGLAAARTQLVFARDGEDHPLDAPLDLAPRHDLDTESIEGTGERVAELVVPYRGDELRGTTLRHQLARWVNAGVIEPSARDAILEVAAHPEWLRLDGLRVAVLGAGAETSPLPTLTSWGIDVLALDLPRPEIWERILTTVRAGASRVAVPVSSGDGELEQRAGANLIADVPEVAAWLRAETGDSPLVLGFYIYADGGLHVQATMAADVLATSLREDGQDIAVAYVGTPSDCYLVPGELADDSEVRRSGRGPVRLVEGRINSLSGGRLYKPAYPKLIEGDDGRTWAIADGLVGRQGPNYALAKRMQRWRSIASWADGQPASFNVGPPAWTQSVVKNRMLAAGYHGAHYVGMEIFPADTMGALMAALMVYDLHQPGRAGPPPASWHPDAEVAASGVHGGYWRRPYDLRSTLVYTMLLGLPRAYRPDLR